MKKLIGLLCLLICAGSGPHGFAQQPRELLDQVIAVVNDDPITQSELDVLLRPVYDQFREQYRGEELMIQLNDARQKILNQLIEDRLVYQEAVDKKIEPEAAEIENALNEFKSRFPNEMVMEQVLQEQGMSLSDVRERFRKQAIIRQIHNIEIRSRVVISPKEIEEYYLEHPEKFSSRERLKTRSVTIKKSYEAREKGINDEEAKKKITEIREKLLAGENFENLARDFSEDIHAQNGGVSDWIEKDTMIAVINDVIFNLKLGEISGIIETPMGYHLFRVEEREQGAQKTLEEVRDMIYEELFRQKSEDRFYDWMQELKRKAYISIR